MSTNKTETKPPTDQADEMVSCRLCPATYVPSLMRDFYPDDPKNPKVGLCEQCMMREASKPKAVPSTDHLKNVCKVRLPGACKFLVMSEGWQCAKHSALASAIHARAGQMRATGDNCSGSPEFKPTA
jgi:hypothetical protein